MKIFDPKKDMTLTTDASEHSISVILSQEGHPIMYLSRSITVHRIQLFKNRERIMGQCVDNR